MSRAAHMATKGPIPNINYPALIRDEITRWERQQALRVIRIKDHCCKRDVRGLGEGFCQKCRRKWISAYTHVTINFKSPESLIRYRQKCSKCDVLCKMQMPEDEFRRITQYAIESMKRCHLGIKTKQKKDDKAKTTPPHKCHLCEKCRFGEGPCCMPKAVVCKVPKLK
ncbi:uncharacterized protein LOC100889045 [Strongylocentrotus purpuratus]|uniref:3CxxC-type domain-containing protein n=1 Tax=Strongylocentrotus purpuratus TaxID=7668 RepID=A0A7M7GQ13_STRPU|nr:uncharacterized protein LOC100889045 [Strongylocentrotus purpuratus]